MNIPAAVGLRAELRAVSRAWGPRPPRRESAEQPITFQPLPSKPLTVSSAFIRHSRTDGQKDAYNVVPSKRLKRIGKNERNRGIFKEEGMVTTTMAQAGSRESLGTRSPVAGMNGATIKSPIEGEAEGNQPTIAQTASQAENTRALVTAEKDAEREVARITETGTSTGKRKSRTPEEDGDAEKGRRPCDMCRKRKVRLLPSFLGLPMKT
jgi:hypothetical protein